ncbi:MAG: cation transporter [Limnohabitans sp.]|nr:cation transporter [Limnohabitans sp.]
MKKIITTLVITISFISCNKKTEETRKINKEKEDALVIYKIPKARCENCQNVIEAGLLSEKGIKQSILNLNTKEVSIVYNPNLIDYKKIDNRVKYLATQIPCK